MQPIKRVLAFFTHGRIFILACMLLLLFGGLILGGKDYERVIKNEKALDQQKQELLPKVENAYKQGLYYAELNPSRSKEYLQEAKTLLAQFAQQDGDVQKMMKDVDAAYATVTKTYLVDASSVYFDMSLLTTQAVGSKLSLYDSALLVSDQQNNVVYKIGTDSRSGSAIIGSGDVNGLVGADGFEKSVYAVSKKGIVRYDDATSKISSMLEGQSSWGTIVDMQVFGNSVYLLDSTNNQIWKYIPEGAGFGAARNYISSESTVSLQDALSFSIDGSVWVGTSKGDVIKFFSGKRDTFSLSGVEGSLGPIKDIYADADSDYLYLYDSKNGRVVVVTKKEGAYVSAYQSAQFNDGDGLVVDVKNKYLYVLNKQKIYRTELREQSMVEKP